MGYSNFQAPIIRTHVAVTSAELLQFHSNSDATCLQFPSDDSTEFLSSSEPFVERLTSSTGSLRSVSSLSAGTTRDADWPPGIVTTARTAFPPLQGRVQCVALLAGRSGTSGVRPVAPKDSRQTLPERLLGPPRGTKRLVSGKAVPPAGSAPTISTTREAFIIDKSASHVFGIVAHSVPIILESNCSRTSGDAAILKKQ